MKNAGIFAVIISTMLICSAAASPESPTAGGHWQLTAGENSVEASSLGIHINQRLPVNTSQYANASKKLIIANTTWKIGFDVRFGTLRPSGAVVRLYKGDNIIGWVGADVWTKNMGVCTGNNNFKLVIPADAEWHHLEYICDGKLLSVWHNGQKVGEDISQGVPDRIFVGSSSPGKDTPAQQTEIWIRTVTELSTPETLPNNGIKLAMKKSELTKANIPTKSSHKLLTRTSQKYQTARNIKRAKHHVRVKVSHPSDYPPMADGLPRHDGISISGQIHRSQPSAELKRMAEDYQNQIIATKDEGRICVAFENTAMDAMKAEQAGGASSRQSSDDADAEYKKYREELRDLVTEFAMLRAIPGYAEHYIETGWTFDKGNTDTVPGVAGLKNIAPR